MTVLFKRHFQVAYLADNVDAAIALFADNYGIREWNVMDMLDIHGQGSATQYIATAWAGDVQLEIIQPIETVPSLYSNWRRDSGLPLRLHHLGFLIGSEAELAQAKAALAAKGSPIVAEGTFGEMLDFAYADTTAQLGHYYELIRLRSGGKQFLDATPVN